MDERKGVQVKNDEQAPLFWSMEVRRIS